MQVDLSSGGYNIISSGMSFLFGEDKDFTINIAMDNGFRFTLMLEFKEDGQSESRIDGDFTEEKIHLQCFNFRDSGNGMCWPVQIGVLNEKKVYLMFWSYLNGDKGKNARSIQNTIFQEM